MKLREAIESHQIDESNAIVDIFGMSKMKRLQEYYRKFDFSIIQNFINDLFDDEYTDLFELEGKYGITIVKRGDDGLVTGASYLPGTDEFVLYLSSTAIDIIDEGNDQFRKMILQQAEYALAHEFTHKQQNQGDQWKNLQSKLIRGQDDYEGYISQNHEIDAHAAMIAQEWISKEGEKFALNQLSHGVYTKLNKDSQALIDDYKTIGGKVWKKFLNEIFDYIEEPHKNSDKLELKQKLKN